MTAKQQPKILGAYELVDFPQYGLTDVQAKIDTGADSGALHCTQIREVKSDGVAVLHFSPFDHPDLEFSTHNFLTRTVRSSNGARQQRYFIKTDIVVEGTKHKILLSLADRSEMQWPVLIGRRFLKKYSYLVDVSQDSRV